MSAPTAPWGAIALGGFSLGFPEDASTHGGQVDALYEHVLLITGIAFLALEAILIALLVRYRSRNGTATVEPSLGKAGLLWGSFVGAVALTLIVAEGGTWMESNRLLREKQASFPNSPDTWRVEVLAEQFSWNFRYPGPDARFATSDDVVSVGVLHVPVGRPVVLEMRSKDVLHSFFLPNFREKQDVVPGLTTRLWFQARKGGRWEILCAELCGLGHYTMRGFIVAENDADLERYAKDQAEYGIPEGNRGWEWGLGRDGR